LALYFQMLDECPLIVAANRDEWRDRPAEPELGGPVDDAHAAAAGQRVDAAAGQLGPDERVVHAPSVT